MKNKGETAGCETDPCRIPTSRKIGEKWGTHFSYHPIFWLARARKTKRPRLDLSLGTSVDQPSPKCCSKTTLFLTSETVNGPSVLRPWHQRGKASDDRGFFGEWLVRVELSTRLSKCPHLAKSPRIGAPHFWYPSFGLVFARKTKRPRLSLSLGTSVDQPSPKCCSKTTLFLTFGMVNSLPVLSMARTCGYRPNAVKTGFFLVSGASA
jgi:hypothetical protein